MAENGGIRHKKGFFSEIRLPVARKYVYPGKRNLLLYIGGGAALLIGAVFAFNAIGQKGTLVSNGPLSSNHAALAADCQACHTAFRAVSVDKCNTCHEKFGDEKGIYTFQTHYTYRSADHDRTGDTAGEQACFACHTEHRGRDAALTNVSDDQCGSCHEIGDFNDSHPEFASATEKLESSNLKFPHVFHVNEIMFKDELAVDDVEQSCIYCHNASPDGTGFEAVSYEQDCSSCHLNTESATPWLPIENNPGAGRPGVATLQVLRSGLTTASRELGTVNTNDFTTSGGEISKEIVVHEDPWIMENLRRLRRVMYVDSGLADLLETSADVDPRNARKLYEESLQTLRAYVDGLRSVPADSVRQDLAHAERLLRIVEERLDDPYAPLSETRFFLSMADRNPNMSAEQFEAFERLAGDLTEPCRQCHTVSAATIGRVRAEQDEMLRAEFNHRAHVIGADCLTCHNEIPFVEFVNTSDRPADSLDHAGLINLPSIETCQSCHKKSGAANTCITCHDFHPDKSQHSNLLRYTQ